MRAIICHGAHDLRVEPAPAPGALAPGHVRVRMRAGGICGSDLHYALHGGFGVVRIREPMTLGHEASGVVEALGEGVAGLLPGQLVAVNPSEPCGRCQACLDGAERHCAEMRFNGSAMRFPHVQGLFREVVDVPAGRLFPMPDGVSPQEAALCEPLAVALHAVAQAGDIAGKRVLVTGCGPIGALVIAAARLKGAAEIVATDLSAHSLAMARRMGADHALDIGADRDALAPWQAGKGVLDAAFECSGSPHAFAPAIAALAPRGTIVAVGLGGEVTLPLNALVAKELRLVGTFRFDREYAEAAGLVGSGRLDLKPLITAVYPLDQAAEAFAHAADKSRATKVVVMLDAGRAGQGAETKGRR
jgi:L-idonate 5-dehydrogenase